jgi:hypothetical protein
MTNWHSIAPLPLPPATGECPLCGSEGDRGHVERDEWGQTVHYRCARRRNFAHEGWAVSQEYYCERCGQEQKKHWLMRAEDGKDYLICRPLIKNVTFVVGDLAEEY